MSLLEVSSVSFGYEVDKEPVLKEVSLYINPGDFISIVGPSGSGKSTLLRILAGHLDPDDGDVFFHDEKMEGPEIRLVPGYEEIQMVHQHFELGPNLTLRGNLSAALTGYTPEYKQERVDFLIDFLGLKDVEGHYPRGLSGGQQQRLAIAMAMANEPEVLLMDEPFSALDSMNAAMCLAETKRLAKETQTAVVLVTHDVRDAMIADQMLVLIKGEIRQHAAPREIYQNPADFEIASLLGPVNRIPAELGVELGLQDKSAMLRVEHVTAIVGGESDFVVKDVLYRGGHQLLVVSLEGYSDLIVLDKENEFKSGDLVGLKFAEDKVLYF